MTASQRPTKHRWYRVRHKHLSATFLAAVMASVFMIPTFATANTSGNGEIVAKVRIYAGGPAPLTKQEREQRDKPRDLIVQVSVISTAGQTISTLVKRSAQPFRFNVPPGTYEVQARLIPPVMHPPQNCPHPRRITVKPKKQVAVQLVCGVV